MGTLAFVFSSGWGSGLNCYLVVLVLGVADRVHGCGAPTFQRCTPGS